MSSFIKGRNSRPKISVNSLDKHSIAVVKDLQPAKLHIGPKPGNGRSCQNVSFNCSVARRSRLVGLPAPESRLSNPGAVSPFPGRVATGGDMSS